jgi:surface polysaccharide O-acyltransferase-like enzyme
MEERSYLYDQVRCIANYMIILMHAGAALQYCKLGGAEVSFWTFVCGCITQIALPALFLISGYLLFHNYSFHNYLDKIKRRIKRLFVPYVIWNITFVVFYLLCGHFVPRLAERISSFGLDTFHGAFSKILDFTVHPIDGPLWFLRTLFILCLISPIFFVLINSKRAIIKYSGFFLILIAYLLCNYYGVTDRLLMTYPLYSITLFYVGGLLSSSGKCIEFKSSYWLIPCIIGLSMIMVVVFNPGFEHSPLGGTINDLGKLLLTPTLFLFVGRLDNKSINGNKVYLFAKDLSFFAYAGHFLFCSMIMHTVASFLGTVEAGKATLLISVFCVVGIPFMALVYKIGERWFPSFIRLYDGTL